MLAVALLFTACGEDAPVDDKPAVDDPTTTDPAKLEINESFVQVAVKGGEFEITYTLTNPNDSDTLEAKSDVNWIHDFDYSIDGTVLFTVDANGTAESRIATLTLEYGKAKDKVTITQSGVGEESVEYEFDIQYEIDGPYVTMNVSAKPENTRYFAWYMSKKGVEEGLAQSPGVDITMYLNKVAEVDLSNAIYYGAYAGMDAETAVAELTFVGPSSQEFELNGDTEFYGFTCAVSKVGQRLSDVVIKEFKTGKVEPSTNELTINVTEINTDRVNYSVKTTNQDQYVAMVLPAADAEDMTDEELVAWFNELPEVIPYLHFGDFTTTALNLSENADYYVLAFGYEYGMLTTEVKREKVHTLTIDSSIKANFSVTVDKVTHFRIKATADAGNPTCLYYCDVCCADEKAEDLIKAVREAAQWFVDAGNFPDLAATMRFMGYKGANEFDFHTLDPETDYRVYAVGIDEKTGEFNTEVFFTDIITTPAEQVSEAHIEISVDTYFDGYDLIEAYPEEFGDADGWAVLPLEVTTHGDVVDYWYDVYTGDLTDTTEIPDMGLIIDLQEYGKQNTPITMSYCYFNEDLTLVYFSKDSNDNNSPVTRVKFKMTPEGCASVEDFEAKYGASLKSLVYRSSREL